MDPFISSIYLFGGNFAIRGFAMCEGQILPISSNTALYSLIGTNFGGNGTTNFALPDLRGRVAVQQGNGPGLKPYVLGEQGGFETQRLNSNQLPSHNHLVNANFGPGTTPSPENTIFSEAKPGDSPRSPSLLFYTSKAPKITLHPQTIGSTGNSAPFDITQPVLALNFLIALYGIFPRRP